VKYSLECRVTQLGDVNDADNRTPNGLIVERVPESRSHHRFRLVIRESLLLFECHWSVDEKRTAMLNAEGTILALLTSWRGGCGAAAVDA
jgi:hypothetical protein